MTRPTCFWNRCGWRSKGRDSTMQLRYSATILLTLAALTLGWSPGLGAEPTPGGTLTVGLAADIAHFDIFHAIGAGAVWPRHNITGGGVWVDPKGNISPYMAMSGAGKDAGRPYIFHLQKATPLHAAPPADAEAIKWNIEYTLDPANTADARVF